YGYGYGYGYGYSYGSTPSRITYNITWNTTGYSAGSHIIKAYVIANSTQKYHRYESGEKTVNLTLDAEQTGITYSGSSYSSNTKTCTRTIEVRDTPKLEIMSIIIPKIMQPDIQQVITITIKNTGGEIYTIDATVDILDQVMTATQDIGAGEETMYTYTITPSIHNLGSHTAKITIDPNANHIVRLIPFSVEKDTMDNEFQPDPVDMTEPSLVYDEKTGTITVEGCLEESIQNPQIMINNKMKIDLRKDTDNCFHIKMSTSTLSPGIHTVIITDKENKIYEQSFTIPDKTQKPLNTPTGALTSITQSTPAKITIILLALLTIILLAWKIKLLKKV
ncbi:MAG: hypothetical protein DRN71_02130, partial [Candidatus Nanohalarchaeota archaeon]